MGSSIRRLIPSWPVDADQRREACLYAGSVDEAEAAAKEILERVVPGVEVRVRDPGGGPEQLHDFDLVRDGEIIGVVEVVTATLERLRATRAAIQRRLPNPIEASELQFSWHVVAEARANVKRIERELIGALLRLEVEAAAGSPPAPRNFFGPTQAAHSEAVRFLWYELAIEYGAPYVPDDVPRVLVSAPSDDREWTDSERGAAVVRAVEEVAAFEDVQVKLSAESQPNPQLFVYIDPLAYPPWRDLQHGVLPTRVPTLPTSVTTLWVATRATDGDYICWLLDSPGQWRHAVLSVA